MIGGASGDVREPGPAGQDVREPLISGGSQTRIEGPAGLAPSDEQCPATALLGDRGSDLEDLLHEALAAHETHVAHKAVAAHEAHKSDDTCVGWQLQDRSQLTCRFRPSAR